MPTCQNCVLKLAFDRLHADKALFRFAGKGRVFKCLQETLAQPDFGAACKDQVQERGLSMQSNYLLDYGVSSTCESDVQRVCMTEKVAALEPTSPAVLYC